MTEPNGSEARTVVAGYDGSPQAGLALARAAQLARPNGRVVAVVAAPLLVHLGGDEEDEGGAPRPAELRARAAETLRCLDVAFEVDVTPLEPVDALVGRAHDEKAEILAVGTRGRGRIARRALGSVSAAVLQHAPCDVLVVRTGPAGDERRAPDWPRRAIVGVDGSPWARRALERAGELVRPGGEVVAVTARAGRLRRAPAGATPADVEALLAGRDVTVRALEEEGDAADVIVEAARARGGDLVVVGTRSRGPARRLLLGSVSTAVAQRAAQDVLVVRAAP